MENLPVSPARPLEPPQPGGSRWLSLPVERRLPRDGVLLGGMGYLGAPYQRGWMGGTSVRPLVGIWRSSGSWCWDVFSSGSRSCSESCRGRRGTVWAFLGCVALVVLLPSRMERGFSSRVLSLIKGWAGCDLAGAQGTPLSRSCEMCWGGGNVFSLGLLENSLLGPGDGGLTGAGLAFNRGDGSFTF